MTDELDLKLGRLLRETRVPARDPFFRIGVMERRERERYALRRRKLLVFALALAALHAVYLGLAWSLGRATGRPVAGLVEAGLIILFALALGAAAWVSVRGVLQAWHWLRGT